MSEQLRLFDIAASALFSCSYGNSGVQSGQQLNSNAPPVALTTGEATDPNVSAHVKAGSPSILPHPRWRKQGCVLESRQVKDRSLG